MEARSLLVRDSWNCTSARRVLARRSTVASASKAVVAVLSSVVEVAVLPPGVAPLMALVLLMVLTASPSDKKKEVAADSSGWLAIAQLFQERRQPAARPHVAATEPVTGSTMPVM